MKLIGGSWVVALLMGTIAWVAATPATAQEVGTEYKITDPVGDVFLLTSPPQPLVPTPVTAPYDLEEIGILGEDEVGLTFYLKVTSFEGDVATPFVGATFYSFEAKLDGSSYLYRLTWLVDSPQLLEDLQGVEPVDAEFCIVKDEDGDPRGGGCSEQRVEALVDWDNGRLTGYITKDALMGRDPVEGEAAMVGLPLLTKGSRLVEVNARSDRFFPLPWTDSAPNEGVTAPAFVFAFDAANIKIKLTLDPGVNEAPEVQGNNTPPPGQQPPPPEFFGQPSSPNEISVAPGVPALVALRLENANAAKRIITLTATVPDAAMAGKFSAQIAPGIQIPGGDSRVINLVVNASADVQHLESTYIIVRGQSLGFADEIAALRLKLIASVAPGPGATTLHFHAALLQQGLPAEVPCPIFQCGEYATWLNTLDEDAASDAGIPMEFWGFDGLEANVEYLQEFELDAPLANALVLDTSQLIEATLAFTTDLEFPGHVEVTVTTTGTNRLVGTGSTSAPIKAGTPVSVPFLPVVDADRIEPSDGKLAVRLVVRTSSAGPGAASYLPNFKFVPSASSITFPFLPDPLAPLVNVLAGSSFLTLAPRSDAEEFLNPGRAKLFNATILNEGIQEETATLEVLYDDADWRVELLPAAQYRLPAGEAAKFGLLAFAPADAQEGDQLHLLVNASSASVPGVLSQLRFTAIVTTGVDIPDESHYFQADEDTQLKVVQPPKGDSPAFEALLLAAALAPALVLLRRRRTP